MPNAARTDLRPETCTACVCQELRFEHIGDVSRLEVPALRLGADAMHDAVAKLDALQRRRDVLQEQRAVAPGQRLGGVDLKIATCRNSGLCQPPVSGVGGIRACATPGPGRK